MPENLEKSAMATGIERSVFIPIQNKVNAKESSNYHRISLTSHTSKAMLKILQGRLQQYVNCEIPDIQAGFRRGREPEIKLPTSVGSSKSKTVSENIHFSFIDYAKAVDYVDHNKLWKILQEMGIPSASWEIFMQVMKQELQLDMEQQTGSK